MAEHVVTRRNVFLVSNNLLIENMFKNEDWNIVHSLKTADLVQFTDGSDVSPSLYGQKKHSSTINDAKRDRYEAIVYRTALLKQIPMAGICRGGQFLNVMEGGSLWQHVGGHTKNHDAMCMLTGEELSVTSTHHQMMDPAPDADIIMVADVSSFKESYKKDGKLNIKYAHRPDVEALHYSTNSVLCFQPHPEFGEKTKLSSVYFMYINHLLFGEDY